MSTVTSRSRKMPHGRWDLDGDYGGNSVPLDYRQQTPFDWADPRSPIITRVSKLRSETRVGEYECAVIPEAPCCFQKD